MDNRKVNIQSTTGTGVWLYARTWDNVTPIGDGFTEYLHRKLVAKWLFLSI